jgi:hypothetical protein
MSYTREQPKPLNEIWAIEDADTFAGELMRYLLDKQLRGFALSVIEQDVYDICRIDFEACCNSFSSLYYNNVFTLADCRRVAAVMHEMGLHQLESWFTEALLIYCRGRTDLTQAEFDELEPFPLPEEQGRRFDEIARQFLGHDSELYKIAEPVKAYAMRHRDAFT